MEKYKCLECGAILDWDAESELYSCPECGSEYDLDDFEGIDPIDDNEIQQEKQTSYSDFSWMKNKSEKKYNLNNDDFFGDDDEPVSIIPDDDDDDEDESDVEIIVDTAKEKEQEKITADDDPIPAAEPIQEDEKPEELELRTDIKLDLGLEEDDEEEIPDVFFDGDEDNCDPNAPQRPDDLAQDVRERCNSVNDQAINPITQEKIPPKTEVQKSLQNDDVAEPVAEKKKDQKSENILPEKPVAESVKIQENRKTVKEPTPIKHGLADFYDDSEQKQEEDKSKKEKYSPWKKKNKESSDYKKKEYPAKYDKYKKQDTAQKDSPKPKTEDLVQKEPAKDVQPAKIEKEPAINNQVKNEPKVSKKASEDEIMDFFGTDEEDTHKDENNTLEKPVKMAVNELTKEEIAVDVEFEAHKEEIPDVELDFDGDSSDVTPKAKNDDDDMDYFKDDEEVKPAVIEKDPCEDIEDVHVNKETPKVIEPSVEEPAKEVNIPKEKMGIPVLPTEKQEDKPQEEKKERKPLFSGLGKKTEAKRTEHIAVPEEPAPIEDVQEEVVIHDTNVHHCAHCNSDFLVADSVSISVCPYCGRKLNKADSVDMYEAESYIPFGITKEKALEAHKKYMKTAKYKFKDFDKDYKVKNIQAVYIPIDVSNTHYGLTQTQTIKDASGVMVNVYKRTYEKKKMVKDMPLNASTKINDRYIAKICPTEIINDRPYQKGIIDDAVIECEIKNAFERDEQIQKMVTDENGGFFFKKVNIEDIHHKYVLFPVWIITMDYKGKSFSYYVNGQNGKISGDIPKNDKKRKTTQAVIGAVFMLISMLVMIMMRGSDIADAFEFFDSLGAQIVGMIIVMVTLLFGWERMSASMITEDEIKARLPLKKHHIKKYIKDCGESEGRKEYVESYEKKGKKK